MCWLTAGWVKLSASAAAEKEPRVATSRNVSSSLRSSMRRRYHAALSLSWRIGL
jgi:hypothetical protein